MWQRSESSWRFELAVRDQAEIHVEFSLILSISIERSAEIPRCLPLGPSPKGRGSLRVFRSPTTTVSLAKTWLA